MPPEKTTRQRYREQKMILPTQKVKLKRVFLLEFISTFVFVQKESEVRLVSNKSKIY